MFIFNSPNPKKKMKIKNNKQTKKYFSLLCVFYLNTNKSNKKKVPTTTKTLNIAVL